MAAPLWGIALASQIDVCNQALIKAGSSTIISLSDGTKGANLLSAIYDIKRDAELAAHPWTFAINRAQLPASGTAPAFGWAYAYPMPTGYLGMVEVGEDYVMYDAGSQVLFQIENGEILTDEGAPLKIRYIKRVTNTGLFSPLFVEALACRLALELCESLSDSTSKKQDLKDDYRAAISLARRMNAIEQPPRRTPDSSWVNARA